jgi:hypothetical protein
LKEDLWVAPDPEGKAASDGTASSDEFRA